MVDQINNELKKPAKINVNRKIPIVLTIFALSTVVLMFIAWILMLAQGIDHGETNTGSKLIVASAITSALAFATSIIAIMCGFKINHTTAGKHDERIYQFTVVAFVFAIASLIMITCMASAVNSDAWKLIDPSVKSTGFTYSVWNYYNVFSSLYTLFAVTSIIFATLASIVVIKHTFIIHVSVAKNV